MSPGKVVPPEKRKTYSGNKKSIFCGNVQQRRLELGLSQAELASLINTTAPRISELEAGRLPRDEERIVAIAHALKVDINWLFGFIPE